MNSGYFYCPYIPLDRGKLTPNNVIESNENGVPEDVKGAVVGFMILLVKGLLDDERWDWDNEASVKDWPFYQSAVADATILRTTLSVFLNTLQVKDGKVLNYQDAKFRGFQYFRMLLGHEGHTGLHFTAAELEEPDWRIWEN